MGGCSSKASAPPPQPRGRDGIRGVGAQVEPRASVPRVKLVLLGDSGVGKSCLVLRYVRGCFDPGSKVTVGAAYLGHKATLKDGRVAKLEVWDTAGQERYASLAPLYYRGAAAAAVVYDVCDRESFAKARHWVGELQRNAGPAIVVVLVGNKVDLGEEARQVPAAEGAEFAERNGMIFVEASAKADSNVREVFEGAAAAVLDGIAAKQQQPQQQQASAGSSPSSSSAAGAATASTATTAAAAG